MKINLDSIDEDVIGFIFCSFLFLCSLVAWYGCYAGWNAPNALIAIWLTAASILLMLALNSFGNDRSPTRDEWFGSFGILATLITFTGSYGWWYSWPGPFLYIGLLGIFCFIVFGVVAERFERDDRRQMLLAKGYSEEQINDLFAREDAEAARKTEIAYLRNSIRYEATMAEQEANQGRDVGGRLGQIRVLESKLRQLGA
ncbi:hypothetical protein [Methylobacterium sp. SD21]|uniref:hypothetical protein n=1 Tax=Methylobacterium litchii TaxID=3138810 RepID=UPI00313E5F7B